MRERLFSRNDIGRAVAAAAREDGLIGERDPVTDYEDRAIRRIVSVAIRRARNKVGSEAWKPSKAPDRLTIYGSRHVNSVLDAIPTVPNYHPDTLTGEILSMLKASPQTIENAQRRLLSPPTDNQSA